MVDKIYLNFNFFFKKCFFLSLLFLIQGCGVQEAFFKKSKFWVSKIEFKTSSNLNDDSPLTIHLVIAYSKDLLKELLKMSSDEYFEKIEQLKADNSDNIEVLSWDLVHSKNLTVKISPTRLDAEGAVIFGRYSSKGSHRLSVGEESEIKILCNKLDFSFEKKQKE